MKVFSGMQRLPALGRLGRYRQEAKDTTVSFAVFAFRFIAASQQPINLFRPTL